MNTCENCKWWGNEKYHDAIKHDYRQCRHLKLFPARDREPPEDGLMDWGSDAGYQDLITGPKFGCIHHEPKPSDKKKCDYCGKPMVVWVGIKRTCYDVECRERAKAEQSSGPKVTIHQMISMIGDEERRREKEPK